MNIISGYANHRAVLTQPKGPRFAAEEDEGRPRLSGFFPNRYFEEVFVQSAAQHLENRPQVIKEWVKDLFAQHGAESAQKIIRRLQPEVSADVRKQLNDERDAFLAAQKQ